jgi:hypothetical protein
MNGQPSVAEVLTAGPRLTGADHSENRCGGCAWADIASVTKSVNTLLSVVRRVLIRFISGLLSFGERAANAGDADFVLERDDRQRRVKVDGVTARRCIRGENRVTQRTGRITDAVARAVRSANDPASAAPREQPSTSAARKHL